MCHARAGTDVRPLLLRRRASRPQLKRDPLGGPDKASTVLSPSTLFSASTAVILVAAACGLAEFLGTIRFSPTVFGLGPLLLREDLPMRGPLPLAMIGQAGQTQRAKFQVQDDRTVLFRDKRGIFRVDTPLAFKGTLLPMTGSAQLEARAPVSVLVVIGAIAMIALGMVRMHVAPVEGVIAVPIVLAGLLIVSLFVERDRARLAAREVVDEILRQGRAA